ncbi:hypothetical protein DFAR_650015 [Desulfarculales bacterium]
MEEGQSPHRLPRGGDRHYYSAPHQLMDKNLDIRYTEHTVECFHKG